MSKIGGLWRIWILVALLGGAPAAAHPFQSVAIRPTAPTVSDEVVLEVTADLNGALCGHALTLAWFSPQSEEITLHVVEVIPDVSCPAVEELFTFEFRLGRLAAGSHTVGLVTPGPLFEPLLSFVVSPAGEGIVLDGRFEIRVQWEDFAGRRGSGHPVPGASSNSALLWFFAPDNWEILVKVLDGCALNGRYWILGSGATTVRFTLEVHDTQTGEVWRHENPPGQPAGTFIDTAFAPCD